MVDCKIYPIPIIESRIDRSLMTYRMNFGESITTIGYIWYIYGLGEKILVDAGANAEYLSKVRGLPTREIQTIDEGLGKLGLGVEDIDIIIITHLHTDHVAGGKRFKRAKFLIQRKELDFARNPHPSVKQAYFEEFFEGLNFEVVEGETKICEEISLLFTPGHTPGGQSVSIKTSLGVAIISGLCSIKEIFEPPPQISASSPVIVPGMHTNVFDAYDSVLRIKEMANLIIPNHDPQFKEKISIP